MVVPAGCRLGGFGPSKNSDTFASLRGDVRMTQSNNMLTKTEIEKVRFNRAALRALPENFARDYAILPVAVSSLTLKIIVPIDDEQSVEEILSDVKPFAEGRQIEHQTGQRQDIEAVLNRFYLALSSTIQNCPNFVPFRCPKKWSELKATPNREIRFCESCQTDVRFCANQDQLKHAVANGECVAIYLDTTDFSA